MAWAEAWDRSQVKPENEVRSKLESGMYETRHSWSCSTVQRHRGGRQPEEPWLKAALELGENWHWAWLLATISLLSAHWPWTTCSTPGMEGNALQAPTLWTSQNPFVFTCWNLNLIILYWCISIKSETDFTWCFLEDYVKAIPIALNWRLSHCTKRCNSRKSSLGHHELLSWHTWILKCNIPQQETRNEIC